MGFLGTSSDAFKVQTAMKEALYIDCTGGTVHSAMLIVAQSVEQSTQLLLPIRS